MSSSTPVVPVRTDFRFVDGDSGTDSTRIQGGSLYVSLMSENKLAEKKQLGIKNELV